MAFTALSFVVPFFSYYVLCNLSHDGIVTKMKIMHIFGLIRSNRRKLCRLTQSTKLNITVV